MTTHTFLLDDIAAMLSANPGNDLDSGTNLFIGLMPDQPDTATSVFEYDGSPPVYTMGPITTPAISQPHLQIVCRDVTYIAARAQCNLLTTEIEGADVTYNGTYYERVARLQDPFFMHRDTVKNRVYFACNFEIMKDATVPA